MNTDYFSSTKRLFLLVGFFAVTTLACAAETPVEIVLRLDAARLKALGAGDGAALAKILSDDVLFIHSDGRIEAKADYIKSMVAGDTAYTDLKTADVQARQIVADVVVLAGAQEMKKKLGAEWTDTKLCFLSVWRNEAGTWRMIAWQSLRPAGNSVVPPNP